MQVQNLSGATDIASGYRHTLALAGRQTTDTTRPTVTSTSPHDGTTYALGQQVTAEYSCEDEPGGSGIASCEGTVPDGSAIDTTTPGAHTFVVEATDNAGNQSTVTHSYTVSECTVLGTEAADTLSGTAGEDVICGLGGNDTLKGLAGNDTLKGGEGNDKLKGEEGDDSLEGQAGRDTASFSGSTAAIVASLETGTATGEGSDALVDTEKLVGSRLGDDLAGSAAGNRLSGMKGDDTLRGAAGTDMLIGGAGADDLHGEIGSDKLDSRDSVEGNDLLDGGTGNDACLMDATERSVTSCES